MSVTVPTVTSLTRTREFRSRFWTSGICAWMVYAPVPPPLVPGNLNEFAPWKLQPESATTASAATTLVAVRGQRLMASMSTSGRNHHSAQAVGRIGRCLWGSQWRRCLCRQRRAAGRGWRVTRRGRGWWRGHVVGSQPILAVREFVGTRAGSDEEILPDRREVVLAVFDDRRQVLRAQLCGVLAPKREAACIAAQRNWMGLAKLLNARAPVRVAWAG